MKRILLLGLALALVPGLAVLAAPPDGKGGGNGGGGGGGNDKEAPTVSVTSPASGATVSGTITISADATDNVGVDSVGFNVDGGTETAMTNTSGSTWEASWDSTSVADGSHTITVTARDAKGNASSDSVNVTTDNGTGPTWPNSQGAIGDSITRAVFADGSLGGFADGQPEHSWATGDDGSDGVNSHFERILSQNSAILGNAFNNSVSGAVMNDFVTQANDTIADAPEYVTVFLGHNDLCKDDVSQIPSDAKFEKQFRDGLDTLLAGLPDATVVVLEIIDVAQLWDCCSNDFGCRTAWSFYGVCQSVTASNDTDRQFVRDKTIRFNDIIRTASAENGVLFEDDIFEQRFSRSDVSDTDCFHPSLQGQATLADISWDETRF